MLKIVAIYKGIGYLLMNRNNNLRLVSKSEVLRISQCTEIVNRRYQNNRLVGINCDLRKLVKPIKDLDRYLDKLKVKAITEWVNHYGSDNLSNIFSLLATKVDCKLYSGDCLHLDDIDVGKHLHIRSGLLAWSKSANVAYGFATKHMENLEDEILYDGSEEELDNYKEVIIVLGGNRVGIDIEELANTVGSKLNESTLSLISDESEVVLYNTTDINYKILDIKDRDGVTCLLVRMLCELLARI